MRLEAVRPGTSVGESVDGIFEDLSVHNTCELVTFSICQGRIPQFGGSPRS